MYLNELNRPEEVNELRANDFTEPTLINDFPIWDKKVVLHVHQCRWLDRNNKNVVLNVYPLAVTGTRYSKEFVVFFKKMPWIHPL